jgi:hypothetical protein
MPAIIDVFADALLPAAATLHFSSRFLFMLFAAIIHAAAAFSRFSSFFDRCHFAIDADIFFADISARRQPCRRYFRRLPFFAAAITFRRLRRCMPRCDYFRHFHACFRRAVSCRFSRRRRCFYARFFMSTRRNNNAITLLLLDGAIVAFVMPLILLFRAILLPSCHAICR